MYSILATASKLNRLKLASPFFLLDALCSHCDALPFSVRWNSGEFHNIAKSARACANRSAVVWWCHFFMTLVQLVDVGQRRTIQSRFSELFIFSAERQVVQLTCACYGLDSDYSREDRIFMWNEIRWLDLFGIPNTMESMLASGQCASRASQRNDLGTHADCKFMYSCTKMDS